MFTNVISVLRSLLLRLLRRRRKDSGSGSAAGSMAPTATLEGSEVVSGGFDMKSEIAKLSGRILEPVAAKLAMQEQLEDAASRIRHAFEELNAKRTTADTDFANVAAAILEPIGPALNEAEFARVADRLSGAMAGFCQNDREKSAA